MTRTICFAIAACLSIGNAALGAEALVPQAAKPEAKIIIERTLKTGKSPHDVAWSPDGKLLAVAEALNTRVVIWDISSGEITHTVQKRYFGGDSLAFTNDGRHIVTSASEPSGKDNKKALTLVDTATGEVARDVVGPDDMPEAVSNNVARMFAISSTHSVPYAAIVTEYKQEAKERIAFYNTQTWSLIAQGRSPIPLAMTFQMGSDDLITSSYNPGLEVWNAASGQKIRSVSLPDDAAASALASSPDGQFLAVGIAFYGRGHDHPPAGIRILRTSDWQILAQTTIATDSDNLRARSLSWSPDGRFIASQNYDDKLRIWDASNLSLVALYDNRGPALAFAPDSRHLAIARDFEVRIARIDVRAETKSK